MVSKVASKIFPHLWYAHELDRIMSSTTPSRWWCCATIKRSWTDTERRSSREEARSRRADGSSIGSVSGGKWYRPSWAK